MAVANCRSSDGAYAERISIMGGMNRGSAELKKMVKKDEKKIFFPICKPN